MYMVLCIHGLQTLSALYMYPFNYIEVSYPAYVVYKIYGITEIANVSNAGNRFLGS